LEVDRDVSHARQTVNLWERTTLGRTGLATSRLGLGPGLEARDVERAFERGINYVYWGSLREPRFGRGIANVARRHRSEMLLVVQTYTRLAWMMRGSLERALRKLGTEYADLLLLGWWQAPPPPRILDAALELKAAGKARHILISCHHRPTFQALAANPAFGAVMVRYNAAHPGAEREVFPVLGEPKPGVVAYTATRWGALLDPRLTPPGDPPPRASDCYRFALSHPAVDVCLSAPRSAEELDEALAALDRGPMSDDELAWMKRVGGRVRDAKMLETGNLPIRILDRLFCVEKKALGP
jgi:aryl-alcohol dehydrogenase-like predicted oxidoreductase